MAEKTTPMMEQYYEIKKQYPDAFLFYREIGRASCRERV